MVKPGEKGSGVSVQKDSKGNVKSYTDNRTGKTISESQANSISNKNSTSASSSNKGNGGNSELPTPTANSKSQSSTVTYEVNTPTGYKKDAQGNYVIEKGTLVPTGYQTVYRTVNSNGLVVDTKNKPTDGRLPAGIEKVGGQEQLLTVNDPNLVRARVIPTEARPIVPGRAYEGISGQQESQSQVIDTSRTETPVLPKDFGREQSMNPKPVIDKQQLNNALLNTQFNAPKRNSDTNPVQETSMKDYQAESEEIKRQKGYWTEAPEDTVLSRFQTAQHNREVELRIAGNYNRAENSGAKEALIALEIGSAKLFQGAVLDPATFVVAEVTQPVETNKQIAKSILSGEIIPAMIDSATSDPIRFAGNMYGFSKLSKGVISAGSKVPVPVRSGGEVAFKPFGQVLQNYKVDAVNYLENNVLKKINPNYQVKGNTPNFVLSAKEQKILEVPKDTEYSVRTVSKTSKVTQQLTRDTTKQVTIDNNLVVDNTVKTGAGVSKTTTQTRVGEISRAISPNKDYTFLAKTSGETETFTVTKVLGKKTYTARGVIDTKTGDTFVKFFDSNNKLMSEKSFSIGTTESRAVSLGTNNKYLDYAKDDTTINKKYVSKTQEKMYLGKDGKDAVLVKRDVNVVKNKAEFNNPETISYDAKSGVNQGYAENVQYNKNVFQQSSETVLPKDKFSVKINEGEVSKSVVTNPKINAETNLRSSSTIKGVLNPSDDTLKTFNTFQAENKQAQIGYTKPSDTTPKTVFDVFQTEKGTYTKGRTVYVKKTQTMDKSNIVDAKEVVKETPVSSKTNIVTETVSPKPTIKRSPYEYSNLQGGSSETILIEPSVETPGNINQGTIVSNIGFNNNVQPATGINSRPLLVSAPTNTAKPFVIYQSDISPKADNKPIYQYKPVITSDIKSNLITDNKNDNTVKPKQDYFVELKPKSDVTNKIIVENKIVQDTQQDNIIDNPSPPTPNYNITNNKRNVRFNLIKQKINEKVTPAPKTRFIKKEGRGEGFSVFVKSKGEFKKLGTYKSIEEASQKGQFRVSQTSSASFKITSSQGSIGSNQVKISEKFTTSKRNPNVFVQKNKYRISSSGEKQEITRKGIFMSRVKADKKRKAKVFGL